MQILKKVVSHLPDHWQTELKRFWFARQIRRGSFLTHEPEYALLDEFLTSGDWVIDVGANVGHYTKRFSDLVGTRGRVIAFEPVPTTFSLLAANVDRFEHANVSLFNAAVSDRFATVGMSLPCFSSGLTNYYQAHLTPDAEAPLAVVTVALDALGLNDHVALVKIDAEGHESHVLLGMQKIIAEHRPILIVETGSEQLMRELEATGYTSRRLAGSPNILFEPNG